jgi:23S rRNA (guanine745-N1)-methyltransferase
MISDVVPYLRCPVCRESLNATTAGTGRALRCPHGHSFDIARQGYVDLSAGRLRHAGDTAAMVAARDAFLAAGHFDAISAAVAAYAPADGLVVDVGAGTGRHLAAVLDRASRAYGLALDVSKPALRRAARAHPRAAAAVGDAWGRLPLADGAAALVLDVFAPRNGAEFRRVLAAHGVLVVVSAAADHLAQLVDRLDILHVDPDKGVRLAASLDAHLTRERREHVRTTAALTRAEVAAVVGMGPSAWHADPEAREERVAGLPEPFRVTVSVQLSVYRPN